MNQATPAQDKLKKEIAQLDVQIGSLIQLKATGMSTVTKKQIEEKKEELNEKKKKLKR